MKSKTLFFFAFIFLINTKILVYSEDYGYISLNFSNSLSQKNNSQDQNVTINCTNSKCNISFISDFNNFTNFFSTALSSPPNIDTIDLSNLRIIPKTLKGMFSGCTRLTKIEGLSELNTSEVIDMSEMFKSCIKLTEIDLSNFDTSLVTTMSYMFYDCYGLDSLNLSNFNTSLVTTMSYMFTNCYGLNS